MKSIEIRCKNCGKKLLSYDGTTSTRYESPVKTCKKCGTRYADPRCREMAIEGIPWDTFHIWPNVVFIIIGALILYRGIHLFGVHQIGTPDELQWLLPSFFTLIGVVIVIGSIVDIIAIKSGLKEKKYEKLRKESEERLSDKSYVYILQDLGYKVPEKYL